jgi:hypothetical protein
MLTGNLTFPLNPSLLQSWLYSSQNCRSCFLDSSQQENTCQIVPLTGILSNLFVDFYLSDFNLLHADETTLKNEIFQLSM